MLQYKGFTLIELVVFLALVAVLTIMLFTSNPAIREENERTVIINELQNIVHYAKTQALIRGSPLLLTSLNADKDWMKGVVLTDMQLSKPIHQWQRHYPGWQLTWTGTDTKNRIYFANNPMDAMGNGHFTLTCLRTHQSRRITLNRLGRLKVATF